MHGAMNGRFGLRPGHTVAMDVPFAAEERYLPDSMTCKRKSPGLLPNGTQPKTVRWSPPWLQLAVPKESGGNALWATNGRQSFTPEPRAGNAAAPNARAELREHTIDRCEMQKTADLTGQRFGKLTVIERTDERQDRYLVWRCKCDCGEEIFVNTKRLTRGTISHCGCASTRITDLTSQRFGKLTVIERTDKQEDRYWV